MFRKGTTLLRKLVAFANEKPKKLIVPIHEDMIQKKFWDKHSELLDSKVKPIPYPLDKDSTNNLIRYQIERKSS